jgi:cyclopropane fatty-acyl-phospholipid synthase-like methyltransferase
MNHMGPDEFEARYRREGDPWGYETRPYEQAKYDATLAACGPGPFARALELGSSIGVLSTRLTARCTRLVTVDASPTAVSAARRRLSDTAQTGLGGEGGNGAPAVTVLLGTIPDDIPDGPYDLVVASEILYYLALEPLTATFARLREVTGPGSRLVAVHWRPAGPERPFTAAEVHARLGEQPWLAHIDGAPTDDYLLDCYRRR